MSNVNINWSALGFEYQPIAKRYVANYKDAGDLACGIRWVLEHEDRQALSDACVKKVRDNYTEEVVARQYIALYKKLL